MVLGMASLRRQRGAWMCQTEVAARWVPGKASNASASLPEAETTKGRLRRETALSHDCPVCQQGCPDCDNTRGRNHRPVYA